MFESNNSDIILLLTFFSLQQIVINFSGAQQHLANLQWLEQCNIELIEQENTARQITFLIVSHEMAIVRRLCGRVTVMIEGRIGAEGTLDEVAARGDVLSAYLGKSWT